MPQTFPTIETVHAEIDAWFAAMIQQPPISYGVEAYNQAHAATADLHHRLHLLITGEALPVQEIEEQPDPEASPTPAALKINPKPKAGAPAGITE